MAGTCRAGRRKRASAVIAGFARKLPGLLLSGLFLYTASSPVLCADPVSLEYEVKAAFLFNFTKFVQWPSSAFADANSAFEICIVGDDPFGKTLDDIVQGERGTEFRFSVYKWGNSSDATSSTPAKIFHPRQQRKQGPPC